MALGNVYQLTLKGNAFTSETVNVFNYVHGIVGSSPSPAAALAAGFDTDILQRIVPLQTDAQFYTSIEVFNYTDPSDFAVIAAAGITNDQGTFGSVPAVPAGVTAGFTYTRSVFGLRSGSKRFSSMPESEIGNYSVTSAYKAILDTTALWLFANVDDLGDEFNPIVVHGPRVPGTLPSFYIPVNVSFSLIGRQSSRIVPTTII